MSHFTARCVLAGLELYEQGMAERFVLPGEQRAPATSDLERAYLLRRGVASERIATFSGLNGTLQQLEPVARLQRQGRLGAVAVVCFAFHTERVREYVRLLKIRGYLAEVERTHAEFLRTHAGAVRVNRDELLGLPQLGPVRRAERGISHKLLALDRPFGRWCPATRFFKLIAGPTITDIERGRARVGLARVEALESLARGLLRHNLIHDRRGSGRLSGGAGGAEARHSEPTAYDHPGHPSRR
jgi:hypothetical protein